MNKPSVKSQKQDVSSEGYNIPKKRAIQAFVIVSVAVFMQGLDLAIVAVGLPAMLTDLQTNLALLGWTITGYTFANTIMMPIIGKLSDDWGRKRLFLISLLIFTISSMAAGLAPNIYILIIFRVVQGIGAGAFLPSATGIISDAFGERRVTPIGLIGSIFAIGGVIGPNLGGFFIDNFSWRWIFFVNGPIGIVLLLFGLKLLPTSQKKDVSASHIDFGGIGLFIGGVLAILFAITNWANNPADVGPTTWVLFGVGAILLILFVMQENRVQKPIIEIKLLSWVPLIAVNFFNFIFGAVIYGLISFIPYYATVAYGTTAGQNGVILTPRSLAMMVVSTFASFHLYRWRYRAPMIAGLILLALSLFLISRGYHDVTLLGIGINNVLMITLIVLIAGIGMGFANPAANNAAIDLIPEKVAEVAGIRGMFRFIGGMMGAATVTLVLSSFQDQAKGMEFICLVFAILLLLVVPTVFLIPDLARQWREKS